MEQQNKTTEQSLFETAEHQDKTEQPLFETMEQLNKQENPILEHNTLFFLAAALIYGICFAIAFYKNYVGVTFPLITIGTLVICGLFLKKSGIVWKTENLYYIIPILLLGISTMFTTNFFTVFFNTVGMLLLITIFMMQQIYPKKQWNLGQYVCNIIFLYICMVPGVATPFINLGKYLRRKKVTKQKSSNLKYIITGILIGIPMLLVISLLLSSADVVFSKYIGKGFQLLWKNIFIFPNTMLAVILVLLGFFGVYAFLSALTLNNMPEWKENKTKKNPITAITFISMITVIYAIFSIIQVIFLFTGGMVLPAGYTYAEYAHQGFFQLLFLCIFNFILVLCCISIFEINKLLKIVLMVFSGCTYVMIASSAYRMILYISSYHLTFLRVLVLWFLVLLAFLMAGVIWNIRKKEFPLFRYGMVVVTACYLLLSFSHFDYWIAKYNIYQMKEQISYEDISYLCSLSLDAVPALTELHPEHDDRDEIIYGEAGRYVGCPACVLEEHLEWIGETTDLNIRSFNISKYQGLKAIE